MHLQSDREGLKERIHSPAPAHPSSANESEPSPQHAQHSLISKGSI